MHNYLRYILPSAYTGGKSLLKGRSAEPHVGCWRLLQPPSWRR